MKITVREEKLEKRENSYGPYEFVVGTSKSGTVCWDCGSKVDDFMGFKEVVA